MSDNEQILNNVTSLSGHDGSVALNDGNGDMKFSVQVEVETYDGDSMNQDGISIDSPIPDSCNKEECDTDVIQIDKEHSEDDNTNEGENVFYLRKVMPRSTSSTDSTILVTQYAISIHTIRKAIQAQSKENSTELDKYLDIAIRNLHGQVGNITLSYYDEEMNRVLRFWRDWYGIYKDTPLLYKCLVCHKGWWRLYPFMEHLKEHNDPNLKLKTETFHHEFYIIAYSKKAPRGRNVAIESNCPKCGRDGTFHRNSVEVSKYRCEGCNQKITTCSKLKEHESACTFYIKLYCERYNVNRKNGIKCRICTTICYTQEELDRHLIDCHLVRSDEPVALEVKICKLCNGKYIIQKYHDCPRKNKSFKCNYCCRKFKSVSLRHIHMHFSKRSFRCMICSASMTECQAMEHYVEHTRNYSLLYYCCKCENKVLLSNVKYYHDHMKHHYTTLSRRRWGGRMLLPTKCVTGEIVKSQTILNIPAEKLVNFICGLRGSDDIATSITQSPAGRSAEGEDFIVLNEDGLNRAQALTAEESKKVAEERELWAMQAQLDAEIQKDIEIEAAISKVFSASNTYLKLMQKESEERELMEPEEELYDDDLIIIDREAEEVTVISDSESEGRVEADPPEVTKTVSIDDSVQKQSDKHNDMEDRESDVKNDIQLPPEEEIYVSSDSEDPDWNVAAVKDEADVNGEAIEMETEDEKSEMEDEEMETKESSSLDNVDHVKIEDLGTKGYEEMLRLIANAKKEIDSDTEEVNATEQTIETPKGSVVNLHECKNCVYVGPRGQYMMHVISRCPGIVFRCSKCKEEFRNLRSYVDHLVKHRYEYLCCPECKEKQRYPHTLCFHLTSHIRSLFLKVWADDDEDGYFFRCKACERRVEPERFFQHWEMKLNGGCLKENEEEERTEKEEADDSEYEEDRNSEKTTSDSEEEASRLPPKLIKEILNILRTRDKRKIPQCNVCSKRFGRRNESKRHLIEHLLVESMLNRASTNNRLRCYFCPKEFLLALDWKQHMREHSHLPAFKCDLCSKCFSDSSNFSKHRKVHNLFLFICDLCGGKFNAKRTLQMHLKMHEKNTLLCKYCHVSFITKSRLRKHEISKHHTIPSSYPCTMCRKRFTSLKDKWDHMWLKHKHRNVCADCPLCKKPFRRFRDVATHMKIVHKVYRYNKD